MTTQGIAYSEYIKRFDESLLNAIIADLDKQLTRWDAEGRLGENMRIKRQVCLDELERRKSGNI